MEHGAGADLLELDRGEGRPSIRPRSVPPRTPSSEAPPSAGTPPPSTLPSRPAHRAPLLVAAAVLGLALAGSLLVLLPAHRESAGGAAPIAPTVATAPEAATAAVIALSTTPADAYIQVSFAATPPEARILIDGAALPSNPFDGKFMKDGAVHRIQIEAAGFLPLTRLLVFDRDQTVDLALQPRPRPEAPGMKPDPYR